MNRLLIKPFVSLVSSSVNLARISPIISITRRNPAFCFATYPGDKSNISQKSSDTTNAQANKNKAKSDKEWDKKNENKVD